MITLYGIKNCDTVRKARHWLEQHHVDYRFHDFRADGLELETVQSWAAELGWENLVNRRSTSWKTLDKSSRENMDESSAVAALMALPTLIKRPVLDTGHQRLIGFSIASYQQIFNLHTL